MSGVLRTLTLAALLLLVTAGSSFAQSPAPADTGPDVWGNMPGAIVLLVPIVIGGALYLSYKIGSHGHDDDADTGREGAVSRALAARRTSKDA